MGASAVFLDGGYLEKVLKYDHNEPRIDFEKLACTMSEPDDLLRAYYYHCLPYQSNPPTSEERLRYSNRHRFTTALSHLPIESFNGTFRQELLRREIFYSLQEAKVLIEQWRREYNTVRPHSSLGYLPPASEAIRPDPKLLNLPLLLGPRPRQNEAVGLTL